MTFYIEPPSSKPVFDVFLSHNSQDRNQVEQIAIELKRQGLNPWIDAWNLTPGGDWQEEMAEGILKAASCAVFVSNRGIGDWENLEYKLALQRMAKDREFRVFIVLLPGIAEPFDANTLPSFLSLKTWVDFRKGVNLDSLKMLVKAIKGQSLIQQQNKKPEGIICPYRGLEPFEKEHSRFFFGRESETQRLIEKIKFNRFLGVLGASGSGKSSLVRAGLLSHLSQGVLPNSDDWLVRVFTPTSHPITQLAANLLQPNPHTPIVQIVDQMMADERTLHLAATLTLIDHNPNSRFLFVVDQFEEIFTLCEKDEERIQFLANLLYASHIPDGRCIFVLTIRADFYQQCTLYPELSARLAEQQLPVSTMDLTAMRRAIVEPASLVGIDFEPGLVDTILDDVMNQPGALPLLEFALLELWENKSGPIITLADYRYIGGAKGAIAKRADKVFNQFTSQEQIRARSIMLQLTQIGEGVENTRRRATLKELVPNENDGDLYLQVVRSLAKARLLTLSNTEDGADLIIDVSHEAIIRNWPRLQEWIKTMHIWLRIHRELKEAVFTWITKSQDSALLYRGKYLIEALELRNSRYIPLSDTELLFIDVSQEAGSKKRRRLFAPNQASPGLRALTLTTCFTLFIAFAMLEKIGLFGSWLFYRFAAHTQAYYDNPYFHSVLTGHKGTVMNAAFSPDGQFIVTASSDGTAKVWHHYGGMTMPGLFYGTPGEVNLLTLRGHQGAVTSASFDPKGQKILTTSWDKTAQLWDASTGHNLTIMRGHDDWVTDANFSPDGTLVVTSSRDCTARIWDSTTGQILRILYGHASAVSSASFSPDGNYVLTAGDDGTLKIWSAHTGNELIDLLCHKGKVSSATFSHNGNFVVTSGIDSASRVWDVRTGRKILELQGHLGSVTSAAFSEDDSSIITTGDDTNICFWSFNDGKLLLKLHGHTGKINSVKISSSKHLMVTGSDDKTAMVWYPYSLPILTELRGHSGAVNQAIFSSDGKYILSASNDSTARLWDAKARQCLLELRGHKDSVTSVALNADASLAVTGSADHTARLWDLKNGATSLQLIGHTQPITSVAFSPDGKLILTASKDKAMFLWDSLNGKILKKLQGHQEAIEKAIFSPDGKVIFSYGSLSEAKFWNIENGEIMQAYRSEKIRFCCGSYSPDGKRFIWGFNNGIAILINLKSDDNQAAILLKGSINTALAKLEFSADGRLVLATYPVGSIIIFDATTGEPITELFRNGADITTATISPDKQSIISATSDGGIIIWGLIPKLKIERGRLRF